MDYATTTHGGKKTVKIAKCEKCGHEWIPRVDKPKECPACKCRINYPKPEKDNRRK
jgi:predicted Zn-ribbon and HTH transcriptional regulator